MRSSVAGFCPAVRADGHPRTATAAAGRFAPGHLGELTTVVPFELVDAVLAETRSVQRRLRDLPSRVGMYFLLAMCLFLEVGYGWPGTS
ncbi:transposase domain-containing protein [Streptomyces griseoincarnatus]